MSKFTLPSGMYTGLPTQIEVVRGTMDFLSDTSISLVDDNYFYFIKAMQQLVPSIDIEEMTIPDFYALVAYARINLFPNSPISVNHTCKGTVFNTDFGFLNAKQVKAKIESKEINGQVPLRPCLCGDTHKITIDDYSKLTVKEFDYQLPDFAEVPRVSLLAEWKRLMKESRYRFIIPVVAWYNKGETLEEKIELLHSDLDTYDKLSKLKDEAMFGVSSRFYQECPSCGYKSVTPIHLDNSSFIREV